MNKTHRGVLLTQEFKRWTLCVEETRGSEVDCSKWWGSTFNSRKAACQFIDRMIEKDGATVDAGKLVLN